MAENDPVLEQRVEALEQFSQARVVEQVGELTERVSSLESAREAESPFLATKEDIARLEGMHVATQEQIAAQSKRFDEKLDAQSEQFSKDLNAQSELFNARLDALSERMDRQAENVDRRFALQSEQFSKDLNAQSERFDNKLEAQSERFDNKLEAQSEQLRREWEERINKLISWMVVTGIAVCGVIITAAAIIINRLPA